MLINVSQYLFHFHSTIDDTAEQNFISVIKFVKKDHNPHKSSYNINGVMQDCGIEIQYTP